MGQAVEDVNRDFRNTGSLAVQRDVFIVHALLSGATDRPLFSPSVPTNWFNWQVSSVVGDCCSRYAFSVLLRSPELAFRNGRDKELEVAEQWDLISHGSTTYTTTTITIITTTILSSFAFSHTPTSSTCRPCVIVCTSGGCLPNGIQLSSVKKLKPAPSDSPFFFIPPLWNQRFSALRGCN